jgi:hypothetical protein
MHPEFNPVDAPLNYAENPRLQQLDPPTPLTVEEYIALDLDEEGVKANDVEEDDMLPPSTKRLPGRPRKRRIRHDAEKEIVRPNHCTRCGKAGHSIRTCKERI